MQHETADKEIDFFKTTRYYRNACESYLKDDSKTANLATLQGKKQDDDDDKGQDHEKSRTIKRDGNALVERHITFANASI
jgi:hypothetical protein